MFKIFTGGNVEKSDSTWVDSTSLMYQLQEIEKTLALRRLDGLGPRAAFALFIAVTVQLLSMGVLLTIVVSGFEISNDSFYGYPITAALVTYVLVMLRSRRPKTWTVLLNQQLTAYHPIDVEAYRCLQQHTWNFKSFEMESLREWLRLEYHAITVNAKLKISSR